MKKFTIFTVILTVVVIVMMAELAVNQYLTDSGSTTDEISSGFRLPEGVDSSQALTTNLLGADGLAVPGSSATGGGLITGFPEASEAKPSDVFPDSFEEASTIIPDLMGEEIGVTGSSSTPTGSNVLGNELLEVPNSSNDSDNKVTSIPDFEDVEFTTSKISVFVRDEMLKSAGFANAYLEEQSHQGYLFKTVYIDDFYDVEMQKMAARTENAYLAKIYVFDIGINSDVNETYQLLKLRASSSTDIKVNETNDFADGSFYMNDPKREKTAFLITRIGKNIFAFSYPKEYHAQIKNMIQLLVWEQ